MKRPGLTISCIGHAGVLLWGLVTFAATPREAPPVESLPVEFISASAYSRLTAGVRNAHKPLPKPKPLADKVGPAKPVKRLAPKVADKPEIRTDIHQARLEPTPEPKPRPRTEPKPAAKPAPKHAAKPKPSPKPKPEPRKAEKPKPAFKPDQIAEDLKKEEAKPPKPRKRERAFKPDQIAEELKKDAARKQPKQAHRTAKFDANQVAALLDKREPRRQVATAATLNSLAALGAPNGQAAQLSQSELDALRAKLISLWNPPPAISAHPDQYVITIRIRLTRDYKLSGEPQVLTSGSGPLFEATRDSALRAVYQAQPYDMLSQPTYDMWKEMDINFDPREVFGG